MPPTLIFDVSSLFLNFLYCTSLTLHRIVHLVLSTSISGRMKELTLEIEYCAFMVAIMMVRIVVNPVVNSVFRWAVDVAGDLNDLNLTQDYKIQFDVNPVALSHGIKLFVKAIGQLGHDTDKKSGKSPEKLIEAFFDLEACTNAYLIKFNNLKMSSDVEPTKLELKSRIVIMRDDILQRNNYVKSAREDLMELKCEMYFLGKDMNKVVKALGGEIVTPAIKSKKSRKEFDALDPRSMQRIGKGILDEVAFDYGETHSVAIFDIVSAMAQKRAKKVRSIEDISEDVGSDDDSFEVVDGEVRIALGALENDEKIKEALENLNRKVLIYSLTDKMEILRVYDLVFDILTLKNCTGNIKWVAGRETVNILSNYPGYKELKVRSIVNWKESSKTPNKKTGRKINQDFDDSVWSKLMICKLEKKVRYFYAMIKKQCLLYD
jgi:hypothetical protein